MVDIPCLHVCRASKKRFDAEEDFKTRAREMVTRLQSGEPAVTRAWQRICAASRKEFQALYDRLGVTLDVSTIFTGTELSKHRRQCTAVCMAPTNTCVAQEDTTNRLFCFVVKVVLLAVCLCAHMNDKAGNAHADGWTVTLCVELTSKVLISKAARTHPWYMNVTSSIRAFPLL